MARRGRLCHASLVRCSQNLRRHIPCRQGASRSSTKVGLGAGCPTGHRPSIAAAVTLDVAGYVAVREPFRRASGRVVAGHVARLSMRAGLMHALMKTKPGPVRKLSIPWGSERGEATGHCGSGKAKARPKAVSRYDSNQSLHFCSQSSLAALSYSISQARSIQPFSSKFAMVARPAGNSLESPSSLPDASFVSALRS